MALDEPKQADQVQEAGAVKFVLAPDVAEIVRQYGGVQIDYVDEEHRRGYTLQLARQGGCNC